MKLSAQRDSQGEGSVSAASNRADIDDLAPGSAWPKAALADARSEFVIVVVLNDREAELLRQRKAAPAVGPSNVVGIGGAASDKSPDTRLAANLLKLVALGTLPIKPDATTSAPPPERIRGPADR